MLEGNRMSRDRTIIMNPIIENIITRRSIRRFKAEQVKEDELYTVLEAGMYAPSAGGRQGVLFAVSQDKKTNEKLGGIKKKHSNVKMSAGNSYISREQPSIADDPGITNAFYGAPTVITLFVPKNFLYGPYDASAAAENMLLAAHSIGLGGCYIGSAWESFGDPVGQEILKKWGVRDDYYAALHVLLGYPKDERAPEGKARKDGRIIRAHV